MAVLTVRNLPDAVRDRLRVRAAAAGTSMEEQVRLILLHASLEPEKPAVARSLQDWVTKLYVNGKPEGVVDAFLAERAELARRERGSD